MKVKIKEGLEPYFRPEAFPTTFCPGCGHISIMTAVIEAIDRMKLDIDRCLFVSGIGCAAWIPSPHYKADTLHVTHGRAIAFATGAKTYNPDLHVFVISGDGDLAAIGGNHLIHAARRDTDLTVICANNMIYGMTGGQVAATTPQGKRSVTTPKGNPDRPFDLCKLVAGAGATHVARWYVGHRKELLDSIERAARHRGFSFLEVISPCPTHYVKLNQPKDEDAAGLFSRDKFIPAAEAEDLSDDARKDVYVYGEFVAPEEA
jgi:2-oxoglutarate ferredoxin oxidoreductase subunit beta